MKYLSNKEVGIEYDLHEYFYTNLPSEKAIELYTNEWLIISMINPKSTREILKCRVCKTCRNSTFELNDYVFINNKNIISSNDFGKRILVVDHNFVFTNPNEYINERQIEFDSLVLIVNDLCLLSLFKVYKKLGLYKTNLSILEIKRDIYNKMSIEFKEKTSILYDKIREVFKEIKLECYEYSKYEPDQVEVVKEAMREWNSNYSKSKSLKSFNKELMLRNINPEIFNKIVLLSGGYGRGFDQQYMKYRKMYYKMVEKHDKKRSHLPPR